MARRFSAAANGTDVQGTFAAGIVKLSSGTSTVNQANTYTGRTWVRAGTLITGLANAFDAASDLTVESGATFDRGGFSQTVDNADINGTVGNTGEGGGLLTVNGTLSRKPLARRLAARLQRPRPQRGDPRVIQPEAGRARRGAVLHSGS